MKMMLPTPQVRHPSVTKVVAVQPTQHNYMPSTLHLPAKPLQELIDWLVPVAFLAEPQDGGFEVGQET